jgi:hypothetical protein
LPPASFCGAGCLRRVAHWRRFSSTLPSASFTTAKL